MSTYVYGFTHAGHPLPVAGLVGVGSLAPPVRLVRQDGLVAIVSDAPENLRAKRRDLEAHQRVLEALCRTATVLPMRFGTVAPDDEAVRTELAESAARYADLLGELAGRTEVNVKAVHHEAAILSDVLLRHRELRERNEALQAAGGGGYADRAAFGERVAAAVEQRRGHDAARVLARLRPHASRVRLGPPVDGCFVNASFLVDTAALRSFESSVNRVRYEMAAYADVRWFGPLPPYSFVAADTGAG